MDPRRIHHRYKDDAAVKYDTQSSPLSRDPRWIDGSFNVLTSIKGTCEKRYGFAATLESNTTTFTNVQRIFGWRKWGGPTFVMANDVINAPGGGQSQLWYFRPGIDTTWTNIYNASPSNPYDFTTFNDTLFFGNGSDMAKWAAALLPGVTKWGVSAPTAPPTIVLNTAAPYLSAAIGWRYVYCYHTVFGHVSSPSPVSASTGPFTNALVQVSGVFSTDPQVDRIMLFRTTDGGGDLFFQLLGSTTNNTSGGAWTWDPFNQGGEFNDDSFLQATTAPPAHANDPPSMLRGVVEYANRLWGFKGDSVFFSNNEEQTIGVAEESFNPDNTFRFGLEVTALQPVAEGLLVHCGGSRIYRISGDTLDTLRQDPLFQRMGTRNNAATTLIGKSAAWLDTCNIIRLSDGYQQQEVSLDIRPDLANINQSAAQMTFHSDGRYQWGVLLDGGAGKLRVYDLDKNQWMPPWNIGGTAIASVETQPGTFKLLLAHGSTGSQKILAMDYTKYTDDGSAYGATLVHALTNFTNVDVTGQLATTRYIMLETGSILPDDIQVMVDDDPAVGAYSSIVANIQNPDLRTNHTGLGLTEKWYKYEQSGRRLSFKVIWNSGTGTFQLYGYDIAGSEMQE